MTVDERQELLVAAAAKARERSYAPYSHFRVGAALLDEDGNVHVGCNVENVSYGLAVCAERVAVLHAVAQGVTRFTSLAIVVPTPEPAPPCGMCLQTLVEFCEDLEIFLATEKEVMRTSLRAVLPLNFNPRFLLERDE